MDLNNFRGDAAPIQIQLGPNAHSPLQTPILTKIQVPKQDGHSVAYHICLYSNSMVDTQIRQGVQELANCGAGVSSVPE